MPGARVKSKSAPAYRTQYDALVRDILTSSSELRSDYVVGLYRHWARIGALERALLKKGILTRAEIEAAELPILKAMRKDFAKATTSRVHVAKKKTR